LPAYQPRRRSRKRRAGCAYRGLAKMRQVMDILPDQSPNGCRWRVRTLLDKLNPERLARQAIK
jgi:hypothetical protein